MGLFSKCTESVNISIENITLSRMASLRYVPVTKCYVTCGHTIL